MEISSNYSKIRKENAYKFIFITSIIAICLESIFIRPAAYGINFIDLRLFYFVAIMNLMLFADLFPLKFFRMHFLLLVYFLTVPFLLAFSNGATSKFFSQFFPISFFSFFYASLIYGYVKDNSNKIDNILIIFAQIFCAIQTIPLLVYFTYPIHGLDLFMQLDVQNIRFKGTFSEPMNLCVIAVPALCISISKKFKYQFICIFISFLSIIFSFSIVGFLGLFLALFILPKTFIYRLVFLMLFFPPLFFFIFNTVYFSKIDNLIFSLLELSLLNSQNPTVFGVLSNLYVCIEVLKDNFLFGGGLGSHETNYYKYILPLKGIENPYWEDFVGIAAVDGNSLFIRITSDFGFIGTIMLSIFIIYNYKPNWIGKICLIYFALILARTGHYFKAEFFFFIFIYIINSLSLNQEIKKKKN